MATTGLCPACGTATHAGDRFCEACGHELPVAASTPPTDGAAAPSPPAPVPCPSCGAVGEPVEGYCGTCGTRLPAPRDHQEVALPGVGAVTDRGRRHHRNEDAVAVAFGDGFLAAVVCDGVSTTHRPDEASQAAVDAALAVLLASDPTDPDLDGAYRAARDAVLQVPQDGPPGLGPASCTFLAAVVLDGAVALAGLGDCRAYWLDDGGERQITSDHSLAAEQVAAGLLSAEEAYKGPTAHVITRWLAADADPAWGPSTSRFEVPGPGRLVLCSDGLWNYTLEPGQLASAAASTGDPLSTARRLVDYANEAGGADNITVVVVDLPLPPDATAQEKGAAAS